MDIDKEGDIGTALANAARTLEAGYDFPYLAHAAMEPMNCVISLTDDGCEAWYYAAQVAEVTVRSDGSYRVDRVVCAEPLRIADMPEVEVHIVPSTAAPSGIGEPPCHHWRRRS